MERHLIPAHSYTLEDLVNLSNTGGNKTVHLQPFRTIRGEIRAINSNSSELEKYNNIYGKLFDGVLRYYYLLALLD